jgi:hypothetical protein
MNFCSKVSYNNNNDNYDFYHYGTSIVYNYVYSLGSRYRAKLLLSIQFVIEPFLGPCKDLVRPDNGYGPITNCGRGSRYRARPNNETQCFSSVPVSFVQSYGNFFCNSYLTHNSTKMSRLGKSYRKVTSSLKWTFGKNLLYLTHLEVNFSSLDNIDWHFIFLFFDLNGNIFFYEVNLNES